MAITRYFGFAPETEFGVAAADPVHTMDPESAEMDPSGDNALIYEGMSGIDRIQKPAPYMSEGSISCLVDDKIFPWFFKLLLGGYKKTGTETGPFTHQFFPHTKSLMDSFTAFVGKDVFEHVFPGMVVSSIELEMDRGFLTASVEFLGGKDEKGALRAPVFNEGNVFANHEVTATLAGADGSAVVDGFTLTIENNADNEAGITIGSRFPRRAYRGALSVELGLNLSFFDTSNLERFWGTATGPTTGPALSEHPFVLNIGDNMSITIPRSVYNELTQPVGGRDRIEQEATIRGLAEVDPSTGEITGPVEISVTNDTDGYGEEAS